MAEEVLPPASPRPPCSDRQLLVRANFTVIIPIDRARKQVPVYVGVEGASSSAAKATMGPLGLCWTCGADCSDLLSGSTRKESHL